MYNVNEIRKQFPILGEKIYSKPLIYFDNAATTQKPLCVLDEMQQMYLHSNANVHRGVHYLSQVATNMHEEARRKTAEFINAKKAEEIVFTRGTTEGLNLLASTFADSFMQEGDEVIVSCMEHHSNIVPWQMQADKKGIVLKVIPINDKGELDMEEYKKLFSKRTKIVSIMHVSNVLGTINPVRELIDIAHQNNVPIMIDGAQSTPHMRVDMQEMDCDFFAFSAHKMYGPTGIGVLYGKEEWLEKLPPYQCGGEMIDHVSFEKTTYGVLPYKFEAGTPDYVASHGLATAIDFITKIGIENINRHENELLNYCTEKMKTIEGMRFFGEAKEKDAVISFQIGNIHHLDMGTLLDRYGIAIRTGHHCAQPLMNRFDIQGTARASFALYNTKEEIDAFIDALQRVQKMF